MPRRQAVGIELLADPTRRRIIALVALRVRHPAEISDSIGLSRPATSRQLRLLAEAGLLRWTSSTIDRRSRVYAIDPGMRESIIAWLAGADLRRVPSWNSPYWFGGGKGRRRATATDDSDLGGDGSA
jgi:DNA-binding transcriptional ArsR family regulator